MGWKVPEDAGDEHPDLQALAAAGYDDYQQFEPGKRFIENLAIWLHRFPQENRNAAYDYAKQKLLFLSFLCASTTTKTAIQKIQTKNDCFLLV